jgi:2-dehydro-3-deoxyphosphogluconate aldolase/(4S)-4-hydroxy-2-oxoglutarate aldolase
MTHEEVLARIQEEKLVAILRGVPMDRIDGVVGALVRGGVRVLEFTYDHNQPDYLAKNNEQVRRVCEAFGDELLVGCGTVLTPEEVQCGYEAGARLMISPNVDLNVIRRSRELDLISMPGAMTPTEVVNAHNAGADIIKLFPAGVLGINYIKALRAPLCHIPMSAVGGVTPENAAAFLSVGVCGLGVGSEMIRLQDVAAHDMAAVTARAASFVQAIAAWEAQKA